MKMQINDSTEIEISDAVASNGEACLYVNDACGFGSQLAASIFINRAQALQIVEHLRSVFKLDAGGLE